jgi:hypothetical protein
LNIIVAYFADGISKKIFKKEKGYNEEKVGEKERASGK